MHPSRDGSSDGRPTEALDALRAREVPAGLLDDLYAAVRERAPFAPPGGGMSLAFLETPRALRVWRGFAVAASLLLALGAGYVATVRTVPAGTGAEEIPIDDARGHLLQDIELPGASSNADVLPVAWPPHRAGRSFFFLPPAKPADAKTAAAEKRWN